ncbi:MAG: cysteine hydrolase family protein [Rubrobacteraceae bacterium]
MRRDAALIVIDVQVGLDDPVWGRRNNPQAERNVARLLDAWRVAGRPVFHARHISERGGSPLRAGSGGCDIKAEARPLSGEPVIEKSVNSAFIGTDLESRLRRGGIHAVVIAGLTTNHCVETTARMAGNLGFETYLVSDATAAFDRAGPDGTLHKAEDVHAMTLANLHGEFAAITDTEGVLKEFESD